MAVLASLAVPAVAGSFAAVAISATALAGVVALARMRRHAVTAESA